MNSSAMYVSESMLTHDPKISHLREGWICTRCHFWHEPNNPAFDLWALSGKAG